MNWPKHPSGSLRPSAHHSMFRRKSLAAKLVTTYVALIVAMSALAGLGILSLTRRYFVDAERQSMLVQAQVVAASCAESCLAGGSQANAVDIRALPPASNIARNQANGLDNLAADVNNPATQQSVQAVLPSNIQVFQPSASLRAMPAPLQQAVQQAIDGKTSTAVSDGKILASVPIRRQGVIVGAVLATGSLDDVESVLSDVRRQVLLALVASAALATLIGVWRARALTKPVRALTVAAHELSTGNFAAPLPIVRTEDELGELTNAFDVLRNAVQSELQARSAFVGDASHELRTPLTAMRGAVEILRSDAGNRPEVRERFLTSLETEMERLLQLVEKLLILDRADHTVISPELNSVDMNQLIHSVIEELQVLAAQRNISLSFDMPDDSQRWLVRGEASQLRQLMLNIIENAMLHAPTANMVDVSMRAHREVHPGDLTVDIRDYGPGIAPADRQRIFDRFTRLDPARARQNGGAGLGLPIARSIARAHRGEVSFVDPSDDRGGVVARIVLPGQVVRVP